MARTHIDIELRWADQDTYGHINNVSIARYLEEARVRVFFTGSAREATGMEQHFSGTDPAEPKMLVANQQIEYLRVLEYSDKPITVELWVGRLGGSSLDLHYEIIDGSRDERTVVVRAITTLVVVDGVSFTPIRLSDAGRASVEPWRDEPLALRRA